MLMMHFLKLIHCQFQRCFYSLIVNKILCFICWISRASQQFEPDQVHLTAASGKIFVESILEAAEKNFRAEFIELGDGDATTSSTSGVF
jgi:hypothetical protein